MTCDLGRFALLIRQRSQRVPIDRATYRDPTAAALALIDAQPFSVDARVLAGLMAALHQRGGSFDEADAHVLSSEGLAIAGALIDRASLGW